MCTSKNHVYYLKDTQNANLSNLNLKVHIPINICKCTFSSILHILYISLYCITSPGYKRKLFSKKTEYCTKELKHYTSGGKKRSVSRKTPQ